MENKKNIKRELKNKQSFYCLWGKCPSCSRVIDGRGFHDVEVYQVFECTEEEECDNCNGEGYTAHECLECDGFGEVQEQCLDCKGKGKVPDELGEKKLIKEIDVLVKKEVKPNSSHD